MRRNKTIEKYKIVFMGTPSFAVPSLLSLISSQHEVIACITQPDRKSGRGNKVTYCDIKKVALEHNIQVLQPQYIKKQIWVEQISKLKPDLFITCAYGQILSKKILEIPKYGCINIHASLLPKYRGASPINGAILKGETKTGITTMMTDIGMDTGDILLQEEINIPIDMTYVQLHDKLAILGSEIIIETLEQMMENKLTREKQDSSQATYSNMLKKEDGKIDFNKSAFSIYNMVRALNPWPSCYTYYNKKKFKVLEASFQELEHKEDVGTIISASKEKIVVACKKGVLNILKLQFDNKKPMEVSMCYHNIKEKTVLGDL